MDAPALSTESPLKPGFWRSRYGLAAFYALTLVCAWTVLRIVLTAAFKPEGTGVVEILREFLSGFQRDVCMALLETIPLLFWFWIVPNSSFPKRWHQVILSAGLFIAIFAQIFLLFVEFFFFEEFKSRFNTVAVDYLLFPQEVFVNIWESYHVLLILIICAILSSAWLVSAWLLFRRMWNAHFQAAVRFGLLALITLGGCMLWLTFDYKRAHVGPNRTMNELANNGGVSFIAAARTRHLDYAPNYRTLPREEAFARARKLLDSAGARFDPDLYSIERQIPGNLSAPKLNLVILLEESLGSEFWGSLGRRVTLTPQMDRLAEESLFFTNIYACGNRTVRGMEGILSSFPPLPGDSIVRRDLSDNVETVARVLKRDGYKTLFVYGGRGLFDGMRSFTLRNGYERFLEQKDFDHPRFTTAWGVSDEEIMERAIAEFRELAKTGQPFLGTVLSVSNHKPYTYPKGAIPENPDAHKREHAVKYADYALGRFFEMARKESFWTNTVFAVVADHGARVYGRQSIPIHSYEIPLIIAGPAVGRSPMRVGELGNSLDVVPTLLGIIGRPYRSVFFGRDLLRLPPGEGRALLNHNRDIGMLEGERMVVLGLMQTVEYYHRDSARREMEMVNQPDPADLELEKDAMALFQVADDLYVHQRYRIAP